MKAELLAVGTELLLGEVVNSNAAWLSQQLAVLGISVYGHVTVGDNPGRIRRALVQALSRLEEDAAPEEAKLLLFTGGLGPTPDDLTIETLAHIFEDIPMVPDPTSEASIRAHYQRRGLAMPASNLKQALRPPSALTLPNPLGTAPGILWDVGGRGSAQHLGGPVWLATFPGVPSEMKAMWPAVAQHLQQLLAAEPTPSVRLVSRVMHFFGLGESALAERVRDLFDLENPTVAPYVGKGQVRLRLVCRAASVAEAIERLAPLSDTIMARAGEHWIGTTDTHEDAAATRLLPQRVGERLRALGWRLAVAESCTGGLVSARLTDVPGSSDYIHANFVTYGNAAKSCWLGVDEEEIARHGAVSSAVALAMAEGARRVTGAQVGLSLTGIAGPGGGTEEKPVGLLFVGLSVSPDEGSGSTLAKTQVFEVRLPAALGREEMKFLFSQHALFYVLKALSSVAIP